MGGYFDVAVIVSFEKDFASFAAVNVEEVIIPFAAVCSIIKS